MAINRNLTSRLALCCLLFSLSAAGQEADTTGEGHPTKSARTSLKDRLLQVQNYLDSAARRKVDPAYIEVPKKPWRVILRYKMNGVYVDYQNVFEVQEINTRADWKMRFEPPMAASLGVWVGYRGLGIGISKSLTKKSGRYFSISSTGAKYGFNLRLRQFSTSAVHGTADLFYEGQLFQHLDDHDDLDSPVWVRSLYLNAYYVFNGRRYSQAAAYNQSVIQRRSSGSFLVGATWYQSSLDYSDIKNFEVMIIGNNVGKIKVHQASIGVGYGYNLVPFRGFVINAMAMPTLSVYNHVRTYMYAFNYELPIYAESRDDYGEWNPETKTWANGLATRPLEEVDGEYSEPKDLDMWDDGSESANSWFRFNVDLRVGLAYNWKNYFVGVQGQFNNLSYRKDDCKVSLFDWYARASFGVRL